MDQRSPEWFKARKNRVTASAVGAILGLSPHTKRQDVMRRMIREHQGLESEFTGNIATDYGTTHEPLALADYMLEYRAVDKCGFFEYQDWLGASPDGLMGDDSIIEIKCPFGLRDDKDCNFKSIDDQPHYYAQIQIQLLCTGRTRCAFYQWSQHGHRLEHVYLDRTWLDDNLPILKAFWKEYMAIRDEPLNDFESPLVGDYFEVVDQIKRLEEYKKELLEKIVAEAGGENAIISGHKLTKVIKPGAISYSKVVKDLIPHADLSKYQGNAVEYWKLS